MKQKTKFKQTEIGKLPEDWEVVNLGEKLDLLKDGSHNPPKRVSHGIKFIAGASDIKYKHIDFSNCTFISEEEYQKIHKFYQLKEGDVLLTIVGTIGNVAIIKKEDLPFSLQRSIAIMRPKKELDKKYLFYFLTSPIFRNQMFSKINPTAQPGIYLGELGRINVSYPKSKEEQHAIAKILSDLDAKIELNNKMNQTLEAIGQALFKKWFVDNPKKENWEIKPLDQVADFLNGLALQKYPSRPGEEFLPVIKIRELREGITASSDRANLDLPESYIVNDGDILFSWSGSLEVVIWANGKGALNQHLFKVSSNEYPKWFYYLWTKHYLPEFRNIAEDKATTMGHIQRRHLTESEVSVPDKKTLDNMNKLMAPLISRIIALKLESQKLVQIRDALLPKLMNGEIRVT